MKKDKFRRRLWKYRKMYKENPSAFDHAMSLIHKRVGREYEGAFRDNYSLYVIQLVSNNHCYDLEEVLKW